MLLLLLLLAALLSVSRALCRIYSNLAVAALSLSGARWLACRSPVHALRDSLWSRARALAFFLLSCAARRLPLASQNRILFLNQTQTTMHTFDTHQLHTSSKKFFRVLRSFFPIRSRARRPGPCRICRARTRLSHLAVAPLRRRRRHTLAAVVLVMRCRARCAPECEHSAGTALAEADCVRFDWGRREGAQRVRRRERADRTAEGA